ncbi:MAG TPA: hypothetical protein VEL31_10305 [Ktedonobacteraceae bacterium]|nr:hypothetical protein [Ktedonobacteraceae bacterium]
MEQSTIGYWGKRVARPPGNVTTQSITGASGYWEEKRGTKKSENIKRIKTQNIVSVVVSYLEIPA